MTVAGFNFRKISLEKKKAPTGKVSIDNNVSVVSVEKSDLNVGGSAQSGLKFGFSFKSTYKPDVGHIEIAGDLLYLGDETVVQDIITQWKEKKEVKQEILAPILDSIWMKCSLKAMLLSQEANLPSPVPLPRIRKDKK